MNSINRLGKLRRLLILIPLVLGMLMPPASAAGPRYLPAVSPGNIWTFGDLEFSCSTFCPPNALTGGIAGARSISFQVVNVTGYNVGLNFTVTNYYGFSGSMTSIVNTLQPNFFLIAGGLAAGDPIGNSTSAPRINGTVARFYAGQNRSVNYISTRNGFGANTDVTFYWDQQYGALVEIQEVQPITNFGAFGPGLATLDLKVTATNLWASTLTDFRLSTTILYPSLVNVGGTANAAITITSPVTGFTGPVRLSALVAPLVGAHPNATVSPSTIPGAGATTLFATTRLNTIPGVYTVLVNATYNTISHFTTLYLNVTGPDFSITAVPDKLSIPTGNTDFSKIIVRSIQGFSGTVSLFNPATPPPLGLSLSNTTLALSAGGSANSTLTITVPSTTPNYASYGFPITGTSGQLSHQAAVSVSVFKPPPPYIRITANPPSLVLQNGSPAYTVLKIASFNAFKGVVNLSVYDNGPTRSKLNADNVTLSPSQTSATAVLESTLPYGGDPGSYHVTVGASGPQGFLDGISLNVTVTSSSPGFAIDANQSSFELTEGASAGFSIKLTSFGGYSDTMNLLAQAPETSCEPTLSPGANSVLLPSAGSISSTATINVPSCTPGGYYHTQLVVAGTNNPSYHTLHVATHVRGNSTQPDFTLIPTLASINIQQGTVGNQTVTVKGLNGFSGLVTVMPYQSDLSVVLDPSTVSLTPGGSANITVTTFTDTYHVSCCYSIGVLARSGSISHTTANKILVNITAPSAVPQFNINMNPGGLQLVQGHPQNVTVTISSLNNFSGTINLHSTFDPQQLTVSFNQTSVTISPSKTATVRMTVNTAPSSSTNSLYTIVTGQSGSISESSLFYVSVTSPTSADFSITPNPSTVSITGGNLARVTLTLMSINGFNGQVTLLGGACSGFVGPCLFSKNQIFLTSGGTTTVTMWVTQGAYYSGGFFYYATTLSGTIVRSFSNQGTVTPPQNYYVQASPDVLSFGQDSSTKSNITIFSQGGFNSPVSLAAFSIPAGLSLTLSKGTVTPLSDGTASANVTISGSTLGSYIVVINATSGQRIRSTAIVVNVTPPTTPTFSLTATPPSLTIPQGGQSTTTITVRSLNGFAGKVSLSASELEFPQIKLSAQTVTLSPGGSVNVTMTVPVPTGTAIINGQYGIIVHASNATIDKIFTVLVTVVGFKFTISANPSALIVQAGNQGKSTITVSAVDGFGTVNLTFNVPSMNIPCSFSQTSLTLNTTKPIQSSTLSCTPPAPGAYLLTVTVYNIGGVQLSIGVSVFAPRSPYLPGVAVGNTFSLVVSQVSYTSSNPNLPAPSFITLLKATSRVDISVVAVSGTNVTLRQTWNYNNATSPSIGYITENVATGAFNTTGVFPSGASNNALIAAGLQASDHVFADSSSATLNITATRTVLGTTRTLNFLNTTITGPYSSFTSGTAWDQATGIVVSLTAHFSLNLSGVTATGDVALSLSQTNLWTTSSKTQSSLTIVCAGTSIQSGGSTGCTITVHGSNPTGTVSVTSSDTSTGSFTPANGQCTLYLGYCSVTYKDTATSSTTAVLTASYPGDGQNQPSSNTASINVVVTTTKTTSSLTISCSGTTLQVGAFTTCTITVTGTNPTGIVRLSTNSLTGAFTPTNGQCTLAAGTCSVTYTDTATYSTTAILTASYPGDSQNTQGSTTQSLSVVKSSTTVAVATTPTTITSGTATADQTSTTGVSVTITGSASSDGTPVTINTQQLNAPSSNIGAVSLSGASYYDVVVSGTTSGTAKICINYSSASSSTTMQYWNGTAWTGALAVSVAGTTVCGQIPVSALTGTSIAVGNSVQPAPSQPNNSNLLFYIITGVIAAVVVLIAVVAVLSRRRGKTRNQ